jgi:hypothetical protein
MSIFDNILNFINASDYKYTGINEDDEYYYSKNKEDFKNDIKIIYDFVKIPYINLDIKHDFIVILFQIYQENNLLQLCIDIDECDYIQKDEHIRVFCSKHGIYIEPYKYYGQTFRDLQFESINEFINSINTKKNYQLIKTFDKLIEDNTIYAQIDLINTSALSKYVKPYNERSIIFFLNDGKLAKYKKNSIKEYFDLNCFEKKKQQEIIDIVNSYYNNLTIIKKPSTNDLIFGIKGQEFIKKVWHKYEQKFYPVINENIKL